MTRRLRSLFRAIYNNNHKTYNHRPNLEVLEDRLAPAGNIIATVAGPYPQHLFREYTASGALVRSVNVPPTPGSSFDYARDVEEDASGKVSIYNGTFTPYLATYNPGTSTWSQITYAGWSTVSNVSYGGLGLYQNFIYATDMNTAGNAQKGIVRFDTVSGNITRFGTNTDFTDLNIGLDSKVYGLAGSTILVFDPVSMAQIRTITLPSADYRGIAVSANGDIYTAAWNSVISRFNTNGTLLQSLTLNTSNGAPFMFSNPDDIDVAADGTVAVGTFSGHIAQLSSTLTNATYIDTGTNNTVFVTFAPAQQTSLSVNDVSVVEGTNVQTTATFTVTLSAPNNSQPVYVQYATGNGTATAPNDYQGTSGSLTFAPGQTSRTVTINIAADPITESTETFTLNLSNPVNATISRAQGTGTIIDDDTPAITINDVAVTEGNGGSTYANFTLSLSNPSPFTVSVGITTSNGTAQSGSDYAALSGATLYFAPGQLSQTVSIQIYGDIQFEADETFKLNLSNPTNATLARTFGTGTILNDDAGPSVTINDVSAFEGNSGAPAISFTVSLSAASSQTVTVNYATANGTASAGNDYYSTGGTLTFVPGLTSQTLIVYAMGDTNFEPDETFTVNLSNPTNASLARSFGTGTILNDDGMPALTITDSGINEGNSGSPAIPFIVSLSSASSQTITVDYATADGTATAGSDYFSTSGTLTFAPGQTSQALYVYGIGDTLNEPDETFTVNLSNATGATVSRSSGTATIVNDDSLPALTINDVSVNEGNSGSPAITFTVSLSAVSSQTVTVNFATADGAATAGSDYYATSGIVTFGPGQTSQTLTVYGIGDTLNELDESFVVNLSNVSGATLARSFGVGTIVNDDALPALTINDVSVTEGNGSPTPVTFTVTLSAASGQTVTVNYATGDGTAVAGGDYAATSGTLTFAAGQISQTVTVFLNADTTPENTETFAVILSGASNATISKAQGIGTIIDDDLQTLSINDMSVTEGNSGTTLATFTVMLSGASTQTVTVNYATANGTATSGSDYTATSGTLTFTPGQTTKTFTVSITGDTLNEGNETFTVNLSSPTNAVIARAQGIGTIVDNDPPPSLSITDWSLYEGNSGMMSAMFTISLSTASGQTVSVNYATQDGTAIAGSDYVAASGLLTFTPGQTSKTVNVSVIGDTALEGTETFYVNLLSPTNATIARAQATNTIINDDGPTISIYSASVNEGNSGVSQMNFTVMLSTTSAVPVTVSYASSDNGSSTAGSDYQAVSGLLTFAPGQTSQTISVNVLGDTLYEGNETFYLRISDGTNGTVGTTNYLGIGTINNDDAAPALTINDVSLTEGNTGSTNATFTISLSAASGLGVGVYYNTIAGTATSGTDYFSTSNYLFIPAGQTSATVSIGVLGDTLKEANETFIVNLYNPSNATLARSQGTATIMDDDPNGAIELSPAVTGEAIDYTGSGVFTVAFVNNTNVSVRRYFSPGTGQPYDDRGLFEYNLAAVAGQQTGSVLLRVYENSFASASQQILVYGYAGDGAISTADGSSRGVLLGSFDPKGGTGWRVVALDLAGVQSLLGASGFLGIRLVGTFDGNTSISTSPNSNNQPLVDFVPGTPPTVPNLSVSDPSVVEGSTAGFTSAMTFTLTLSQASATPVTVTYQFADGTATVAGGDYSPPSYTIIFNAGETQKTVDVKVWQDSAIEADETFMFQVTGAANAAIVKGTGTGTIINDDFPVVSVAPATVTEGNSGVSYAAFTISLSAPSPQSVSVSYATSDIVSVAGPPGNYATAGVDYQATSGTATFAPGQTTVTVLVPVFGDTAVEPDELFAFGLSNPVHGRFVNYTYVSGATIANDDVPAVSVADATVAEGNNGTTAVTFTVTLDQAGLAPVTVNYQTADGTATAGSDYQAASGTLTFNPGQSQKTITVLVNGDTLAENGETFFVNLSSVSGGTLAQGQATGTIDNDDHAPVANAGPDQTADEATVVTFDANGSSDADNDTLTFTWNFGDGGSDSGVAPTHTFSDNGIYTVTLTASDGVNTSASTMTVTVANVAPISFVSGPVDGVRGQQRDFTFSATDVSAPDQAASFSYQIDWGDGTTQTVEGPASGSSVAHVYADTGSYAVSVTATDKDSGVSSVATAAVTIASVQLQGGDLYIGGTTGDDQIIVQPADASGGLEIFINGEDQGTFTPTGKVVVFGQAGDDVIQLAALPTADGGSIPFTSAAVVFGGDGNDTIDASGASAGVILVGGAGNDTLLGGSGSDVLIGGSGADTLHGGAGDDLLVGGASAYDANLLALALLSSEWSRTDADYQTRIDHLNGTAVGGINGNVVLDGQSVFADGVPADVWGEAGQDWFVLAGGTIPDRANDLEIGESVTSL